MNIQSLFTFDPRFWQDYQYDKVLGQGAFGKVILVTNVANGVQYAVKLLKTINYEVLVEVNTLREITAECENVVQYYSSGIIVSSLDNTSEERLYAAIVMEYLPGKELLQTLDKWTVDYPNSRIQPVEVWRIYHSLVSQLACVHQRDIVHGDIKLENIIMDDKSRRAVLVDYGLSCSTKETITDEGIFPCGTAIKSGTLIYMAPEVIFALSPGNKSFTVSRNLLQASDIWSLGIVMYAVMTLGYFIDNDPREGAILERLQDKLKSDLLRNFYPERPALELLVTASLSWDTSGRPTAEEVLQQLEAMSDLVEQDQREPYLLFEDADYTEIELFVSPQPSRGPMEIDLY